MKVAMKQEEILVLNKKTREGSKGQIFTLDVLVAILGITILLGITVQYQTTIKDQTSEISYREMNTLASDASQIAVKRIINEENTANKLKVGWETELTDFLDRITGEKYDYQVRGSTNIGNCGNKEQATSKRIVNNEGDPETLSITICPN